MIDTNAVKVPYENLSVETLDRVIREFVLREGTDYGHKDYTIAEKTEEVKKQLANGKAFITYDFASESCSIVVSG